MATLYKNKGGIPESEKGQPNGVATLDATGKVPLEQLPGGMGQGTVDSVNSVSPDVNGNVVITTSNIAEGTNLYWTQTRFNNASATISQTITDLQSDLADEVTNRTNADGTLDTRVTSLEGEIVNKASNNDLSALDTRVTSLEGEIVNKASNNDLSALDTRVTTAEGEIDTLQSDMLTKASSQSVTDLATRVTTAESDIDDLQADILTLTAGVDLRALEADLQSEITNRTNADNALDLRLDDVEAHHLHSNSYYVNDGVNDFQTVLTEIGADQGNVIYASAGSFGGATLDITNKVNLGIICPEVGNTICELAGGRGLSIGGTSERIRITNLQVEGATSITGTKGRHIFQGVDFLGGLSIDGVTDTSSTFLTFTDCEFSNQNVLISNITNCTIYFNRCNLNNLRIIPSNVASPFLIIVSECSGLNALQTNLTSGIAIVGRTGYSSGIVKVFSTSSNFISALGVETSFTGSYNELRDKPTLVTASTQLTDSADLLRTSDKGVANGVAELDSNGLIPNHHIPPLALTKPYVVQTIAERDALTGINTGDVAIVVDDPTPANNGNYIYDSDAPGWIALYNSTSPVSSVNGQIGAVTLYTGDISEGQGAQGEASKLYFTDSRALSASVTNDIDDLSKAPDAPTVKLYVTGLTDALDARVDTLESTVLNFATTTYVDNGLAGKLDSTTYTASDVLTKIKTVDGAGSGLDADLLDGLDSSAFVRTTTAQTIAGVKTFSSSPIVPDLSANDNSTKSVNSKYVDSAIASIQANIGASGTLVYQGTYDATTNAPSLTSAKKGFFYQVSVSGTLAGISLTTNDQIVFVSDVSGGIVQATDFIVIDNTESGLASGGVAVSNIGNGATMQAGVYYLYDGSSNISINVPARLVTQGTGAITYLRIRGTGQVTLNATGVSGGEFIVYADSGTVNGVKSVVLTKAGEYKLICTRRTISGTVYAQWDVTVSNDRALRTTDDLSEGTTNKYASATNVRALLSATSPIVYTQATGVISTTLTQYTDELAQDASASLFTGGTHTGISYSYVDNSNVINSTVSLSGFSINALSDVDTATVAPTNGQALVWESASSQWKPSTITGVRPAYSTISVFPATISAPSSSISKVKYYINNGSSNVTVNLPSVSSCDGVELILKRLGSGTVMVDASGSETIDGALTFSIPQQYASLTITATSSGWYIE